MAPCCSALRHDRDLFQLLVVNPAQIKAGLPQMKRGPLRFCPDVARAADVLAGQMIRVQVAPPLIRMFLLRLLLRRPILMAVFIHAGEFLQQVVGRPGRRCDTGRARQGEGRDGSVRIHVPSTWTCATAR